MARICALFLLGACLLLGACEPLAIAIVGAGASAALRYNMDGVASRTFTAPVAAVKSASLAAIERMGLELDGVSSFDTGETILARAQNREIELELEPISKQATRIRITAKGGSFLYDNATAYELVQQTEKLLEAGIAAAKLTPAVPAQAPAAAAAGASKITF
jgi:hypothetical protein